MAQQIALNDILGLDTLPILVKSDGEIETDIRDQRAPEHGSYGDDILEETIDGWTALHGFSGQHGYDGAVMHASEYVSGGLEKHIRETPGYYAVETIHDEDGEAYGWIVLHKSA